MILNSYENYNNEDDNDYNLEWIGKNNRFGMYFNNNEAGWFFVNKNFIDDGSDIISSDILEEIYKRIGIILNKEGNISDN